MKKFAMWMILQKQNKQLWDCSNVDIGLLVKACMLDVSKIIVGMSKSDSIPSNYADCRNINGPWK